MAKALCKIHKKIYTPLKKIALQVENLELIYNLNRQAAHLHYCQKEGILVKIKKEVERYRTRVFPVRIQYSTIELGLMMLWLPKVWYIYLSMCACADCATWLEAATVM